MLTAYESCAVAGRIRVAVFTHLAGSASPRRLTIPVGEFMTVQNEITTHGVTLTDAAASKAKALLDQEGRDDLSLRIAVQPGGCAGLRYQLFFDDRALNGDLIVAFGG